jgi:hypothetical protein
MKVGSDQASSSGSFASQFNGTMLADLGAVTIGMVVAGFIFSFFSPDN